MSLFPVVLGQSDHMYRGNHQLWDPHCVNIFSTCCAWRRGGETNYLVKELALVKGKGGLGHRRGLCHRRRSGSNFLRRLVHDRGRWIGEPRPAREGQAWLSGPESPDAWPYVATRNGVPETLGLAVIDIAGCIVSVVAQSPFAISPMWRWRQTIRSASGRNLNFK